jgi:hypothetical protein
VTSGDGVTLYREVDEVPVDVAQAPANTTAPTVTPTTRLRRIQASPKIDVYNTAYMVPKRNRPFKDGPSNERRKGRGQWNDGTPSTIPRIAVQGELSRIKRMI